MRRFQFKLESVLHHRRTVENLRLQALAAAQVAMARNEERLAALADDRRAVLDGWPARVDIDEIARRESYLSLVAERIAAEECTRLELAAAVEAARSDLVEAKRAREALDRLRDKAHAEYVRNSLLLEQNALDEIAVALHGPRAAAGSG